MHINNVSFSVSIVLSLVQQYRFDLCGSEGENEVAVVNGPRAFS